MASGDASHESSGPILQAGVVPFRRRGQRLEFCLITSMSGRRWGFPKGIVEADDSPEVAALKEAHEEAGLHGTIVGEPLGSYQYRKWGTTLDVTIYLMEVSQSDRTWEESDMRERAWLSAASALDRLDRPELQSLLRAALDRITC